MFERGESPPTPQPALTAGDAVGAATGHAPAVQRLTRRERLALVLLFAVAAGLLLGGLGTKQLWKSEARWGQVAREMLRTGDYFAPTINGEPFLYKPLLGYWLVVWAAKASGGLSEWAVRVPSALTGLLVLVATVSLGRRLWSARVAITAGWLLLTTYGFLFYARLGMADMENMAAIMLAVAWYWRRREQPGFVSYAVLYAICAVGAQTKGVTAILVPLAAIFPDVILGGRWRKHLNAAHAAALAVGAAIYLTPLALSPGGLASAYKENVQRAIDPFDHAEPFYVYFYHVPILFLPWSPILILAIAWVVQRWKQTHAHTRWLALATLLIFAMFTASGSRRSYYILPILPFAALLCSVSIWSPGFAARKRLLVEISRWGATGVAVASLLGPVAALAVRGYYGVTLPAALTWGTPVIGLVALVPLWGGWLRARASRAGKLPASPSHAASVRGRWLRRLAIYPGLAPAVTATAILMGGFFFVQYPAMDFAGGHREFAAALCAQLPGPPGSARVAIYKEAPATFVYYMDQQRPMHEILKSEDLSAFLSAEPGPCAVVVHERFQSRLRALGFPAQYMQHPAAREGALPWQGDKDGETLRAFIVEAPQGKAPTTQTSPS